MNLIRVNSLIYLTPKVDDMSVNTWQAPNTWIEQGGDISQTIGTVTSAFTGDKYTSGFGPDLYSSQYKASTITVTFKA